MKTSQRLRQLLLLVVDILVLYVSLFLTLLLRRGIAYGLATFGIHVQYFSVIFIVWIAIYYVAGFYDTSNDFDDTRFAGKLVWTSCIGASFGVAYFYISSSLPIEPKTVIVIDAAITIILMWLWRFSFSRLSRNNVEPQAVAFVGFDPALEGLVEEMRARPRYGYKPVAFFDDRGSPSPEGLQQFADAESFVWMAPSMKVQLIVISDERELSGETRTAMLSLMRSSIRFMRLDVFYEYYLRKIPIGAISDFWFLENVDLRSKRFYKVAKRGIDALVASIGLVVFLPFGILVAAAVKLSSPGPVFFTQTRLGMGGKSFTVLKFRTMRVAGNNFAPTGKKDPRVTPIGNFFRKTRIDEVPQFFNIVRGDMSFIGPRPERPELAEELERLIPYYKQRLLVKPGLSGWDQVSGEYHSPSVGDTYKKLQNDLYYVKNMSFMLDISITAKTIATVLSRAGQ
jgi:exopolysaccharide biosynthesis polyprenyl glycosylphosphotransferase